MLSSSRWHEAVLWLRLMPVILLPVVGCRPMGSDVSVRGVVLVTIDTLRADRLGAYGGSARTPVLDSVAAEGAVFLNAFASSPLTLPSHSSILTGTYPTAHGVRDNGRFTLSEEAETFAEMLQPRGYATAAFVGAFPVDSRFGLDQGFDEYDDSFDRSPSRYALRERRASEVISRARRFITSQEESARFFAWVHLFDPHAPYEPPAPFASTYEGEVGYVDQALEELFSASGSTSDVLFVVTADHGEGLGEHGEQTHSLFVYDSTLHVPLILKGPGIPEGSRVDASVRSIDILPTVLDLLGIPGACSQCQGESLVPLLRGSAAPDRTLYAESYFARLNLGWSELRSVRRGGWKYIAAPEPELYHVVEDPGETVNLAAQRPDELAELASELEAFPVEEVSSSRVEPETLAMLRNLGYLAANAPTASEGPRPDPKSRLYVWEKVRRGIEDLAREEPERAVEGLETVLAEEPELLIARDFLAAARFDERAYEQSLEQCVEILKRAPNDFEATLLLGKNLLRVGRDDEARRALERASELDPESAAPWTELAQLHLSRRSVGEAQAAVAQARKRDASFPGTVLMEGKLAMLGGDIGEAERRFRAALESVTVEEDARVQLGNLLLSQRRLDEAEALFEEGLALRPRAAALHLGLGHSRALGGKMKEAIASFEKALELEPDNTMVLTSMGFALLQAGRTGEGGELLARSLALEPNQPEVRELLSQLQR